MNNNIIEICSDSNKLKLQEISWFIWWKLYFWKWNYFYVSQEVVEYSNASIIDTYVLEIFNLFIKAKLDKIWIKFDDAILILAHWKSTNDGWEIFWDKHKKWILVEELLEKLPQDKLIVIYSCNQAWYIIRNSDRKVVYPLWFTNQENLKFHISKLLLEALN